MPAVLSIVIPSRLAPVCCETPDELWLERAVESIKRQVVSTDLQLEIIVGLDHAMPPPNKLSGRHEWLRFAHAAAGQSGQAAAVNAAAAAARGQYLAILEDDDRWQPVFLEHALKALADCDFVSSNQFIAPPGSNTGKITDFPTPSSWFMRRGLWDEIGGMDPTYRYHHDNDWLGRLSDAGKRRIHLIETTAPEDMEELRQSRPNLYRYVTANPELNILRRHNHAVLVGPR